MNSAIFVTLNSFTGLPSLKHLLNRILNFDKIICIQCNIKTLENYFEFSKILNRPILSFEDIHSFNNQNIYHKLVKYIKLTLYLLNSILFKNKGNVYVFTIDLYSLLLSLVFKHSNSKIFYIQYEMIEPNLLNKYDRFFLNCIKKKSHKIDYIITPEINRSQYLKNIFLKSNEDIFYTIPNSNTLMFSDIQPKIEKNKIVVTHIGAVGLNHHIKSYLDAIAKLDVDKYEFRFIGLLKKEVYELVNSYPNTNILCLGQLLHRSLDKYYMETDIGVILYKDVSLNHRYCAPNKLYEYWSYGIPVLGDNLPGLRGVFSEKFLGELVDMNNSNMISEAIVRLSNKCDRSLILNYFQLHLNINIHLDKLFSKL